MRAARTGAIVVIVLAASAGAAGGAPAADRGTAAAKPSLRATPARALPKARVLVAGRRFHRARRSAIFLGRSRLKTFKTTRDGSFRFRLRMPARAPGLYTLSAKSGRRTARFRVRVLRSPAPPPPIPGPAAQPASQPVPPTPTKLVAAGDIACHPSEAIDERPAPGSCHHAATSDRVIALDPDFVAPLGDLQYERGLPEDYLGSYAPTWGRFKGISRPAPGNHEYAASADKLTAPGYYGYFGDLAGDPTKGYYTYEAGDWQAVALNSGDIAWTQRTDNTLPDDCFPESCAAGSEQEAWLRALLASLPPEKCVVAYWHHPLWSSVRAFEYDEVAPLYEALYDHGAELVLVGHSHAYERFAPMRPDGLPDSNGVRELVIGTGGKDRRFADPTPASTRLGSEKQLLNAAGFGVLELNLLSGGYSFRFVHEGGAVLDEGSANCHRPPPAGG